ncbi:MAG: hypothetical protein IJK52_09420, partial [Oscillospiraceae bacterium]|nr:hypothetical protein [Oscillospiraceae bacterium]
MSRIEKVPDKEKTILLLDALDESDAAVRDFEKFITDLYNEVQNFYRVIITSRTNFFTNVEKERLFHGKSAASTMKKIYDARKYYIAPFTDEDIQHYLHQHYRGKKYRQAWKLVDANKKLSVRPLMLRYMDDMIRENVRFSHDFELYEYLFRQWIAREADKTTAAQQALYDECLTLAKAMYYQWMKDGRVGIYPGEIDEAKAIPGLSGIRFQGHAILNRTSDGMYKFAHRSYWEYLLARLALNDPIFSEDLLIRNFEQAEAFLKEMIAFADSDASNAAECRSVAARLGTANYYLKYWRPEEAEKTLLKVLESDAELSEEEDLFAQIHLIRSYRYQWKEASAERVLLPLYERLNHTELTVGLLPLFAQFGIELAAYSRNRTLTIGREFLRKVIDFCKTHVVPGYDVFVCYEGLCHCVLNFASKQTDLAEMQDLIIERLDDEPDEYADYLYMLTSLWKTSYGDANLLSRLETLVTEYERFLDSHAIIQRKCDLGYSVMAVYQGTQEGDWDKVRDDVATFLKQATDVCRNVYDDESEILRNPYIALITNYMSRYFDLIPERSEKSQEDNEKLLAYRHYAHLEEEMQITYCRILQRAGKNTSVNFSQRDAYLQEWLEWACAIQCHAEEIDALWAIYVLYDDATEADSDGQAQLKAAFDLARTDSDYQKTPEYCKLLQVVIEYYKGEIDKNALYHELRRITPGIYGNDARRARIYRCLRDYAKKINDPYAVEFAKEVLRCEFDRYQLKRGYVVYAQFSDETQFIADLEALFRDMPELTEQCLKEVDAF